MFFGPNLHRKGVIMGHTQNGKKKFLAEITKADHQLSKTFSFIKLFLSKYHVLTEFYHHIYFYHGSCFLSKKVPFLKHLKTKNIQNNKYFMHLEKNICLSKRFYVVFPWKKMAGWHTAENTWIQFKSSLNVPLHFCKILNLWPLITLSWNGYNIMHASSNRWSS